MAHDAPRDEGPAGKPPAGKPPGNVPRPVGKIWWILLSALLLTQFVSSWLAPEGKPVPYSEFEAWLDAGRVSDLHVTDEAISGTLKDPQENEPERFVTVRVDPELADRLTEKGVAFTGVVRDTFLTDLLSWVLPALLLFAVWMFLLRRMMGGAGGPGGGPGGVLSFGKSKARIYAEESVKVTFDDVAGVDEAKEELQEVIGFLEEPDRYGRLGGRLPKGILLVGPPGTGKTLLARAVAGEAGVPFFSISGSEFVELFVGVGASRVRDLFEQARAKAPCLIFIDELDSLGRARGLGPMSGGHDEKEQTLNQLLAELDGFDPRQGVVLLAATNRPEILDPALLRAGRFDRQILVDRPDRQGRADILRVHVRDVTLAEGVDIDAIAALTPGFTGADLANLVNEAAILATRHRAESVGLDDFTAALERIVAGLEKRNRLLNPLERKVTAYHEMGHALVARALPGTDPVFKVSIIPRGIGSLGYTIQRPIEDRFLMTRSELGARMAVLLGGRTAEELVFGEISTGASDDLARCTDIARAMVTRYGMHDGLGLVSYEDAPSPMLAVPGVDGKRDFSETTAREIDCAVRELVEGAHTRARRILEHNRDALERGALLLLEKETLTGDDLPEVLAPP